MHTKSIWLVSLEVRFIPLDHKEGRLFIFGIYKFTHIIIIAMKYAFGCSYNNGVVLLMRYESGKIIIIIIHVVFVKRWS